jgi:hypothetical protein
MSSTGNTNAGSEANNSSIGVTAWSRLNDALYPLVPVKDANATDTSVRLLVGGVVVGDNKAQGVDLGTGGPGIVTTYGGSTDLWGQTITSGEVNSSDFGVVFSCTGSTVSQYLELSSFGFSIPEGANIDGVKFISTTETNSTNVFMLGATVNVYYTVTTPPVVSTTTTSLLKKTIARVGGNVTSEGTNPVTERGIYYGTDEFTQATKIDSTTTGEGAFPIIMRGLTADTTYYYKAYATSTIGTSYGDVLSFTTGGNCPVLDALYALPPFTN